MTGLLFLIEEIKRFSQFMGESVQPRYQAWALAGIISSPWLQGRNEEGAPGPSGLERTSVHLGESGLSFSWGNDFLFLASCLSFLIDQGDIKGSSQVKARL